MSLSKRILQWCVKPIRPVLLPISLLGFFSCAVKAQVAFTPPTEASNSSTSVLNEQVAVDSLGNINVAWGQPLAGGGFNVFFARSSDGGLTFGAPVATSTIKGGDSPDLSIAVGPTGNIYILWENDVLGGDGAVFFTVSTDGGATFSTQTLSDSGFSVLGVGAPHMAVDGSGNIDIIWTEFARSGPGGVFFRRSTDGGASFSSPVNVSAAFGSDVLTQMAPDSSGNIYLVMDGQAMPGGPSDIFLRTSTDGGATFSTPANLSNNPADRSVVQGGALVAAASASNINIAWTSYTGPFPPSAMTVSYLHSSDGGVSFTPAYKFTSNVCQDCGLSLQMDLDSLGAANLLWGDGTEPLNYARSIDGEATFSTKTIAVSGPYSPPLMAIDPANDIDVAFLEGSAQPIVAFTQSTDRGATFSPVQPVSGTADSVVETTDKASNAYLGWRQRDVGGNLNVFLSRSVGLSSVSTSVAVLPAGGTATGTVTLNGPAPVGGAVITLSSNNPGVTVPASVTISQGSSSATFEVTISPSALPGPVQITADFNGVTQSLSLQVKVVYTFSGFFPPLENDGSSGFHAGRTLPVKFQLTAPDGSLVTNATATIQLYAGGQAIPTSSKRENNGTQFRFDPGSGQYIYNLDTNGLASGTYMLQVSISDGSTHCVAFALE